MILSLLRKAVAAGQVAVVGNMETEGLYHRLSLLKVHDKVFIDIPGQKLLQVNKFLNVLQGLLDLLAGIPSFQSGEGLVFNLFGQFFRLFQLRDLTCYHRDGIVNHRLHHMDGTAVDIHHNIVAIILILMNHWYTLSFFSSNRAQEHPPYMEKPL